VTPASQDPAFHRQRNEAFDAVIALIEGRIKASTPAVLLQVDEMSVDSLRQSAALQSWSLFLLGIRHLKDGAPDSQPGSMTEALSRMSLRSSPFAAAFGVKPPHFEQMYFSVDYTTGAEAAFFFCQKILEAAEEDLSRSRQIIQQKIMAEKPAGSPEAAAALKKQMVLSFNVLSEAYAAVCHELRAAVSALKP